MEKLTLNSHNEKHDRDAESSFLAAARETRRQLWREMQVAYQVYQSASDALDASACDQDSRITTLSAEQRAAFEKYIDARLQYSEFLRDQDSVALGEHDELFRDQELQKRRGFNSLVKMLPLATSLILIAAIASASMYYAREQRHIHDLTLDRDQVQLRLAQMEGDLRAATRRLDTTGQIAVTQPPLASPSPGPVSEKRTKPARRATAVAAPASAPTNARSYYDFRLPLSNQFRQVGQVRLSIRGIDRKRKSLDVLMITGSKMERKQVRLNVPVPISQANGKPRISLVATRIDGKYVDGYLIQPLFKRVETSDHRARVPATTPARTDG
jgi:hypothetical protein